LRLETWNPSGRRSRRRSRCSVALILAVLGVSLAGVARAQTLTGTPTSSSCSTETTLCLAGRFLVEATWTKPDGESGQGQAVPLTADSGYFWFLDANNVEVAVKALNGCSVNGHSWIFSAGLTNLAVAMTVTDTATNQSKTYSNPQGTPFQTIADTTSFAACPPGAASSAIGNPEEPSRDVVAPEPAAAMALSASAPGCVGSDAVLCLSGRFQVEATWQAASGSSGAGHAANLTSESGFFWFFDSSNVELVVKALDACAIGDGQWFFAAGMTTVGVQLKVTDTLTGDVKNYANIVGVPFPPILDTAAFSNCQSSVSLAEYLASGSCIPGGPPSSEFLFMAFSPTTLNIRSGDTVTWAFQGGGDFPSHSITSGIPHRPDGKWDSGIQAGPFTFSHTFTETGTFPYYCSIGHSIRTTNCGHGVPFGCCVETEYETGVVIVNP
jgi:hypothetical protein